MPLAKAYRRCVVCHQRIDARDRDHHCAPGAAARFERRLARRQRQLEAVPPRDFDTRLAEGNELLAAGGDRP